MSQPSSFFPHRRTFILGLLLTGLLPLSGATLYWTGPGANASGTWQEGAGNWSTDLAGTSPASWTNANRDVAEFRSSGPTRVVVADTVAASALTFQSGGHTLSGATLRLGRASDTGHHTVLTYAAGTGDTVISNSIVIHDAGTVSSTANYIFSNTAQGALTLEGDVSLDYGGHTPAGIKTLFFHTGSPLATLILGGNINPGAAGATASRFGLTLGQGGTSRANAMALNGTFRINGSNTAGRITLNGGTVIVGNDNAFGSGFVSVGTTGSRGDVQLLLAGPRTFGNSISVSGAASARIVIGGATADDTTFNADLNLTGFGTAGKRTTLGTISNPNPILTAVAGGKVNFAGLLNTTAAIPRGFIKEGAGIVSLTRDGGNNLKGPVFVNEGTLLLMNSSGSATGDASQLAPGSVGVSIEPGARLGGIGTATGLIGASASTSVLTPGDMTKEGISSIGTLNLLGGFVAKNGATFAFDINGGAADQVHFGSAALALNGIITCRFTELGGVRTGTDYRLLTGSGDWSSSSPQFIIQAPPGYAPDPAYGSGKGYVFDPSARSLTVRFLASSGPASPASSAPETAVPEPSIYTLASVAR